MDEATAIQCHNTMAKSVSKVCVKSKDTLLQCANVKRVRFTTARKEKYFIT